jgi:hypothetical protein
MCYTLVYNVIYTTRKYREDYRNIRIRHIFRNSGRIGVSLKSSRVGSGGFKSLRVGFGYQKLYPCRSLGAAIGGIAKILAAGIKGPKENSMYPGQCQFDIYEKPYFPP